MSGRIAVINAGSSSIKFALYGAETEHALLFRGQIEQIGVSPKLHVKDAHGHSIAEKRWPVEGLNHLRATEEILETMVALAGSAPVLGVGHRVVHGGEHFTAPVRVSKKVMVELSKLSPLAPLHQPHNLAPINTIAEIAPHIPQVACFDTAFHGKQPRLAQLFGLPHKYTEAGVRRYGFHGLSYEYVASRLKDVAPQLADGRVIIAHLGNGASLCGIHHGQSVATTMGFTAADGLVMGTRCGALDPGVLIHLMDAYGLDARALEKLIYRESGLLGVSGISSDMRELQASTDPAAAEAIALFVYRIVREIGSLAGALGGLDGLVFTGGIGENDAAIRGEIMEHCRWLGLSPDTVRNSKGIGRVSIDTSRVSAVVIPTDEERMVARHTSVILGIGKEDKHHEKKRA